MTNCCGDTRPTPPGAHRRLPELDRITWRDGQLLASRDVRDEEDHEEKLRHLHVRYLHRTWGVVQGLGVQLLGGIIRVLPGYALDVEGRELLLPRAATIPPPAGIVSITTMYLVISHESSSGAGGCDSRLPDLTTLCPGGRNSLQREEGSISWKTVKEVRLGHDVPLARVLVSKGHYASVPDSSIQRRAASFAQTLKYSDATQPGQTGWTDAHVRGAQFVFAMALVDTTNAGFIDTPAYFARVSGGPPTTGGYIAETSATAFTFVLRTPLDANSGVFDAATAEALGVTIAWLAVELPPPPSRSLLFLKGNRL